MEYSIGQISEKFNLTISQIRYYDKEGLLPNLKRVNGVRKFDDNDVETIFLIECLKKCGLQIKEIKQFIEWTKEGDNTIDLRLEFFNKQKQKVEKEMQELNKVLGMVKYKCWYYQKAKELNSINKLEENKKDLIPSSIQKLYDKAHS